MDSINATTFQMELHKLVKQACYSDTMSPVEIVGIMETEKLATDRFFQAIIAQANANEAAKAILPAGQVPQHLLDKLRKPGDNGN